MKEENNNIEAPIPALVNELQAKGWTIQFDNFGNWRATKELLCVGNLYDEKGMSWPRDELIIKQMQQLLESNL